MKNVLITGTSSGIGASIAQYLAQKGLNVIGTSRKKESISQNYKMLRLDVTDDNSVKNFFRQVEDQFDTIDVLINNAGMGVAGPVEDLSMEVVRKQFETNYFGLVRMTKAVLPLMRVKNKGLIINISSMSGLLGMPFQAHYAASKFAVEGFTESLRLELVPFNVQVTNINPGDFKTDFTKNRSYHENISAAYQPKFSEMMDFVEKEENNGADPILIAKLVHKLIQQPKGHKIRYVVGKKEQTLFIGLKRIIGNQLFEKLAKSIWKL